MGPDSLYDISNSLNSLVVTHTPVDNFNFLGSHDLDEIMGKNLKYNVKRRPRTKRIPQFIPDDQTFNNLHTSPYGAAHNNSNLLFNNNEPQLFSPFPRNEIPARRRPSLLSFPPPEDVTTSINPHEIHSTDKQLNNPHLLKKSMNLFSFLTPKFNSHQKNELEDNNNLHTPLKNSSDKSNEFKTPDRSESYKFKYNDRINFNSKSIFNNNANRNTDPPFNHPIKLLNKSLENESKNQFTESKSKNQITEAESKSLLSNLELSPELQNTKLASPEPCKSIHTSLISPNYGVEEVSYDYIYHYPTNFAENANQIIRVFFNFCIVSALLFLLFCTYCSVLKDIRNRMTVIKRNLSNEILDCQNKYFLNNCDVSPRVPLLEVSCKEFEKCMNQEPEMPGELSILTAELLGEVINTFIEQLKWRTIAVLSISFLAIVVGSNWALSLQPKNPIKTLNYSNHEQFPLTPLPLKTKRCLQYKPKIA